MKTIEISQETKDKVLQCAANILREHGSVVGDRTCQAWSGEDADNPESMFTKEELRTFMFSYEQYNSNGVDYDPDNLPLGDEMMASFVLAHVLESMVNDL